MSSNNIPSEYRLFCAESDYAKGLGKIAKSAAALSKEELSYAPRATRAVDSLGLAALTPPCGPHGAGCTRRRTARSARCGTRSSKSWSGKHARAPRLLWSLRPT